METEDQRNRINDKLKEDCVAYIKYVGNGIVRVDGYFTLADFKKIVEIIEKAESDDNTGTSG